MTAQKYIFKGISENVTECDCCGKMELKKTVVLLNTVTNDFEYFGTTCAKKAANWSTDEFKAQKDNYKKEQHIITSDENIKNTKGIKKANICQKAIDKGYSKDELFIKHGEVIDENKYYTCYAIEHLTHMINK